MLRRNCWPANCWPTQNCSGLLQSTPEEWFGAGASDQDTARIESLIEQRNAAREARDFATADRIRDQLGAEGIILEDAEGTTRWRRGLKPDMPDPNAVQNDIICFFQHVF